MIDDKLKTIVTLDELKSYTNTARALNISQPAVTQHVQALEDYYNIIIFKRIGKNLITTQEGELLIKYAKRLLALNKNLEKELKSSVIDEHILDIGITLTASDYFIPEILTVFKIKYPNMKFTFHTDLVNNIFNRLRLNELDFAIIDGSPDNRSFDSHLLAMDELILIFSNTHKFNNYKEITLDMLKDERLILRNKEANSRMLFENHLTSLSEHINNFNVILEIENNALIRHLVRDNHGISVMPKSVCRNDLITGNLKTLPIKKLNINRGIYLITRKYEEDNEIIKSILKIKSFNHIN